MNTTMTKEDIEEEISLYEDLISYCLDFGLDGVIKTVKGVTEYWYVEDMKNWIEEDYYKLLNEI